MGTRRLFGLVAAALLAACSDATAPVSDGVLRATATRREVRLTNLGAAPVFVDVYGQQMAPLWDRFVLCVDAVRCPPIAPGETRAVPRPSYEGRPERVAVVDWWRAVADPEGAPRGDSVRTLLVHFP